MAGLREEYTIDQINIARLKAVSRFKERTKRIRVYNQKEHSRIWKEAVQYYLENPEEV